MTSVIKCFGIALIVAILECEQPKPAVVSDYAAGCTIIRPSRKDTPETLRQVATANEKCRKAKGKP